MRQGPPELPEQHPRGYAAAFVGSRDADVPDSYERPTILSARDSEVEDSHRRGAPRGCADLRVVVTNVEKVAKHGH